MLSIPLAQFDAGETPAQAAIRELKEETGYQAEVACESPALSLSPGLTSESIVSVHVSVDMSLPCNQAPKQQLEEHEEIEVSLSCRSVPLADPFQVITLPVKGLRKSLDRLAREEGLSVFGPLYYYALGLEIAESAESEEPPLKRAK